MPLAIGLATLLLLSGVYGGGRTPSPPGRTARMGPSALRVSPSSVGSSVDPISGWYQLAVPGTSPPNRTYGDLAFDAQDGYTVLFGGCPGYGFLGSCRQELNDTWTFSGGAWTQLHPTRSPPARSAAVLAYDPALSALVLFGGTGANGSMNDTWSFSNGAWTQFHPAVSPPPLASGAMAFDSPSSDLVLYGGLGGGATSGVFTTWTFNGATWKNVTTSVHPPGWDSPFLGLDPKTGGLLLFGGVSAPFFPTYSTLTWGYQGGTWTNLSSSSGSSNPGSRVGALGGYDPALNETLYFGGGGGTSIPRDLWAYTNAGSWQSLSNIREPGGAFYQTQATWDATDGYLVDFSTESVGSFYGIPTIGNVYNQTWALLDTIEPSLNISAANVSVGANVSLGVNLTGGLPPYRVNWTLGDGTNLTFPNVTLGDPSASEVSHAYAPAGTYNVTLTVTDSVGQQVSRQFQVNASAAAGPGGPLGLGGAGGAPLLLWAGLGAVVIAAIVVVAVLLGRRGKRSMTRATPVDSSAASVAPESPDVAPGPPSP